MVFGDFAGAVGDCELFEEVFGVAKGSPSGAGDEFEDAGFAVDFLYIADEDEATDDVVGG